MKIESSCRGEVVVNRYEAYSWCRRLAFVRGAWADGNDRLGHARFFLPGSHILFAFAASLLYPLCQSQSFPSPIAYDPVRTYRRHRRRVGTQLTLCAIVTVAGLTRRNHTTIITQAFFAVCLHLYVPYGRFFLFKPVLTILPSTEQLV